MAADNWTSSLAIILKEEGGNDDDPRDPGGRTSRGITQREYDVFRATNPGRPDDVWQASDIDVSAIYHLQYWDPYCDQLPAGVDLVFFNANVNSGRHQAVVELQRALGVTADGALGMMTQNAVAACKDIPGLIRAMCDNRRKFYRALKTFPTFGKGWLSRTDRIQESALDLVASSPALKAAVVETHATVDTLPAQPTVTVSPKASANDADAAMVSPEASGAVAAGSGSIAGTLTTVQQQLSPFADTIHFVQYILLAIAIVGIGYMTYGVVKRGRVAQAVG